MSYIIINEHLFQYFELPWKIATHKAQGHLLRNVQFEGLLQTGNINPQNGFKRLWMRNLHSPSSQNGQVQGLTLHFLIRYTVSFPLSITSKFPYETENKRWQCIYTEREQSPQAATVTSIELIKSSSKFSARASSVMRSTQASLMSLHTECHLLPYMSPHQGTSALSH